VPNYAHNLKRTTESAILSGNFNGENFFIVQIELFNSSILSRLFHLKTFRVLSMGSQVALI